MPDDTPTAPESPDDWRPDTRAIRAGRQFSRDSLAPVLFPSTTYEVGSVDDHRRMAGTPRTSHYYSRFGSPSVQEFEAAVAELEGAEAALASSSGMAAVTGVVFGLCSAGDHIVVQRQLFSVTSSLFTAHLPRFGIEVTFVDGTDPQQFVDAVRPGRTQLVFVETPANPALSLTDIEAVAGIPGPFTVVDSTFATPMVQQPLALGADLVLHAATKGIAGHNDALLGVVAGSRDLIDAVWGWHVVQGGQASPFDAWNGLRGIRTLGGAGPPAVRHRPGARRAPRGPPGGGRGQLPRPRLAPPARPGEAPDVVGGHAGHLRAGRRARRRPAVLRVDRDRPHRAVARRARDAGHPPRDHRRPPDPGRAGRDGHHRRSRAHLGRARGPRRPDRGPRPGPRRRGWSG